MSWITVTLCSAVAAFSAGQQEMTKGEVIMNNACVACHDLRPIQMQAMDKDGWTKLVESMVARVIASRLSSTVSPNRRVCTTPEWR